MKKLRITKTQRTALIISGAVITAITAVITGFLLVSRFYSEIYNTPRNINAVIDVGGMILEDKIVASNMGGEWEFFYNKWIITDGEDGAEPDGLMRLPGRWTDMKINGKTFPAEGYASFRLKITNMTEGSSVYMIMNANPGAVRVFINGQINSEIGVMSKDARNTKNINDKLTTHPYIISEGEELIVTIELSATKYGGLLSAPWIRVPAKSRTLSNLVTYVPYIITGVLITVILFIIISSLAFYRKNRSFSLLAVLFALFMYFVVTKDGYARVLRHLFPVDYIIAYELCYVMSFVLAGVIIYHLIRRRIINLTKYELIIIAAVNSVCFILYYIFMGYTAQFLSVLIPVLSLTLILYRLSLAAAQRVKESVLYIIVMMFIIAGFMIDALDNYGFLVFGTEVVFSVIVSLIVITLAVLTFISIKDNANAALNAVLYKQEMEEVKKQALQAQIKPHFIFNSLTSIQSMYHKDINKGDTVMEKFARHLRLNVDSYKKENIHFDEELNNVLNYFELENLRLEERLTLLLDIEYTDFRLPILSLQPLVENAVKHAGTDKKEDGYIQIRTRRNKNKVILEVLDNGNGFDPEHIRQGATGLKNASERLKYAINAEMEIQSRKGEGTAVVVKIPILYEA